MKFMMVFGVWVCLTEILYVKKDENKLKKVIVTAFKQATLVLVWWVASVMQYCFLLLN